MQHLDTSSHEDIPHFTIQMYMQHMAWNTD